MNPPVLEVVTFETGPLQENAYLVVDRDRRDAAIVDPGDDGDQLIAAIEQAGAKLRAIWLKARDLTLASEETSVEAR